MQTQLLFQRELKERQKVNPFNCPKINSQIGWSVTFHPQLYCLNGYYVWLKRPGHCFQDKSKSSSIDRPLGHFYYRVKFPIFHHRPVTNEKYTLVDIFMLRRGSIANYWVTLWLKYRQATTIDWPQSKTKMNQKSLQLTYMLPLFIHSWSIFLMFWTRLVYSSTSLICKTWSMVNF